VAVVAVGIVVEREREGLFALVVVVSGFAVGARVSRWMVLSVESWLMLYLLHYTASLDFIYTPTPIAAIYTRTRTARIINTNGKQSTTVGDSVIDSKSGQQSKSKSATALQRKDGSPSASARRST